MAFHNVQNQEMDLVLSSDAKPRLKWTPELHRRFIDAVNQLGGPEKVTPRSLMRVMDINGLTLYHLKSHLQKYRLGKSQQPKIQSDNDQEDSKDQMSNFSVNFSHGTEGRTNESIQISQALQMQMEVQRKLYEQIEVQKHLQLRLEAQGKYLQSVLVKAQETLAGYNYSSLGVEMAKAELSQLVSMVDRGCPSSSLSELTDVGGPVFKCIEKKRSRGSGCSLESSLTSSDCSLGKEDIQVQQKVETSDLIPLLELQQQQQNYESRNQAQGKRQFGKTLIDLNCIEQQPSFKRLSSQREQNDEQSRKSSRTLEGFDLNIQFTGDSDLNNK